LERLIETLRNATGARSLKTEVIHPIEKAKRVVDVFRPRLQRFATSLFLLSHLAQAPVILSGGTSNISVLHSKSPNS
jgi:hypothetical protein